MLSIGWLLHRSSILYTHAPRTLVDNTLNLESRPCRAMWDTSLNLSDEMIFHAQLRLPRASANIVCQSSRDVRLSKDDAKTADIQD